MANSAVQTIADGPSGASASARDGGEWRPSRAGRFAIQDRLGRGAMAVVYVGYDADLDRKVAVKFLRDSRARSSRARRRMQREAQAMARLSHANAVHVYEVGEQDERVYIAMEYVDGGTLRDWLDAMPARRSWREILSRYIAAGRGLAAAHAAGIIHRDFKPENVMLTKDGVPKVGDFGLAGLGELESTERESPEEESEQGALTRVGALVGTPNYMSPEQHRSEPADERSDQFSFCVALWESLHGKPPFGTGSVSEMSYNVTTGRRRPPPKGARVPAWVERACDRGLSLDPAQRWPSMEALLDALERGQSRARTRRVAGGAIGIALAAGGVLAGLQWDESRRVAACEARGAEAVHAWDQRRRDSVRNGLLASGVTYAASTADRVVPLLDAHVDALRHHVTEACLQTNVTREWDERLLDRAAWCVDGHRLDLFAVIDRLEHANDRAARRAPGMVADLARPAPCNDRRLLENLPMPPTPEVKQVVEVLRSDLARVHALNASGDFETGLSLARTSRRRALEIGWPPLMASAYYAEGSALAHAGRLEDAEAAFTEAYMQAADSGAWATASDAATRLVFEVGYKQARYDDGRLWRRLSRLAARAAGDPLHLRKADRLDRAASVENAAGNHEEAIRLQHEANEIWNRVYGPDALRHARGVSSLAGIYYELGDFERAEPLFRQALEAYQDAFGPTHPTLVEKLSNLGVLYWSMDRYDDALPLLQRTVDTREVILDENHPVLAQSLSNLAMLHRSMGNFDESERLLRRSLSAMEKSHEPSHPNVTKVRLNLGIVYLGMGQFDRARPLLEQGLAALEQAQGPEHIDVASALADLADVLIGQGDLANALPLLERSVAIFDAHPGIQRAELITRFVLADTLMATGADRRRGLRLARELFLTFPVDAPEKEKVAQWIEEHE